MKRLIIFLFLAIFLASTISADVIITEQPKELYNFGETIEIPIKITSLENLQTSFKLDLICNGVEKLVHFENIGLSPGQEKSIKPIIILNKNSVERAGDCVVKATLGSSTPVISKSFKVSDYLKINLEETQKETAPQNPLIIEGEAIKENGELVQGKVNLKIESNNQTLIEKTDTVKNGYFHLNLSFPKDTPSGQYLVQVNVYENDLSEQVTNKGFLNYNVLVTQVPTSLEIVLDSNKVEPGNNLKLKTILHDQTGESIEASSIVTIKDDKNKIIEQFDKETDSYFELPIKYNQAPSQWKIVAVSSKLSTEELFNITEKEDLEINIINKTVVIKNSGNVPYCDKPALVKIGNESLNIDVCLNVDEEQKYYLNAPEGEYEINVVAEGEERVTGNVALTGRAISVKEVPGRGILGTTVMWSFIVLILGSIAFMFFKKGYKKSFFGYIIRRKEKAKIRNLTKDSLVKLRNKAELSLSIKGEKQNSSIICLRINDLKEKLSKKTGVEETIQNIVNESENNKFFVYENGDYLFFVLAPIITKTFKNEKTALNFANKIKETLSHHNRLMKDKVDFGVSLNYGTIVARVSAEKILEFMSMGTLITTAKKLAGISKEEILLSDKINEKLITDLKTEKQTHGSVTAYSIKEIRNKEGHTNFLSNFVKRLERDKKEKEDKERK